MRDSRDGHSRVINLSIPSRAQLELAPTPKAKVLKERVVDEVSGRALCLPMQGF